MIHRTALGAPNRLSLPAALAAALCGGTLLLSSLLVGCASMQDDRMVSVDDSTLAQSLASLEEAIVPLDAEESPDRGAAIASARERVTSLQRLNVGDTVFQARLAAWSGRLFLAAGKRSEAARDYAAASRLFAFDGPTVILAARLEKDGEGALARVEKALLDGADDPRLLAERARLAASLGRYAEAVAGFDAAFPRLPPYYRDTYGSLRDRSWSLRDADSAGEKVIAEVLAKEAVSWQDVLTLTLAKSPLLDFETAGKGTTPAKLFPKLSASGVIPPRGDGTARRLQDPADRAAVARYLWRLAAEHRSDKALLTKYSLRWGAASLSSPIPDVPVSDPAFDSVMGCVENEIMALPDGRNFMGAGSVSGSDFARMLAAAGR